IERANLFLIPLDEVRGWWRYHHLFADLLRARLEQTRPERLPGLHRAAAAWHEAHGFADDAVRHALAAGEVAWAARLVERHVESLLRRSEGATLGRWLAALPAEAIGSRARLCLAQAIFAVTGGGRGGGGPRRGAGGARGGGGRGQTAGGPQGGGGRTSRGWGGR